MQFLVILCTFLEITCDFQYTIIVMNEKHNHENKNNSVVKMKF